MLLEENRNCGCDCGCNNSQNDNCMDTTSNTCPCSKKPERKIDCEERREMMQQIRCLDFAINDLALYLDTHPEDEKALCLHRKYCKEVKELKNQYQKVYGPLTINFPCNKWRWLEEPWGSFCLGVF